MPASHPPMPALHLPIKTGRFIFIIIYITTISGEHRFPPAIPTCPPSTYLYMVVMSGLCLVWSGLVWPDLVWSGLVWPDLVWYGLVWSGLTWSGLVWPGVAWSGLVWPGVSWRGLV